MKKYISFDKDKKVLPILLGCLGAAAAAALFVFRLNRVAVLSAAYMIVVSVILLLGVVSVAGLAFTPLMDFTSSPAAASKVTMLVLVLYIGGELVNGFVLQDNISQLTHIVGGVCGALLGISMRK